jgi:hypothetical protein
MTQESMTQDDALFFAQKYMMQGESVAHTRKQLGKRGLSENQVDEILADDSLMDYVDQFELNEKIKNEEYIMNTNTDDNVFANSFSKLLEIAITYGVTIFILVFGAAYVFQQIQVDLAIGIRSLAAAILPLVIMMAFQKSHIRNNAIEFLTEQKIIAFVITFSLTMLVSAIAMYFRDVTVIPIGELVFSTTLSLMIFGNNHSGQVSYLHVGAVSGFLSYVILFGLPLSV